LERNHYFANDTQHDPLVNGDALSVRFKVSNTNGSAIFAVETSSGFLALRQRLSDR